MTGTQISVPKALELVRNSETGEVHPGVDATLEKAVVQLWSRIQASPDRYIMNKDEFAVFNYFQERFKGDETARKAVARFWNNFKGEIPRAAVPKLVESGLGHRCSESTGDVVRFIFLIALHSQYALQHELTRFNRWTMTDPMRFRLPTLSRRHDRSRYSVTSVHTSTPSHWRLTRAILNLASPPPASRNPATDAI
ncbi:hypothetical protein MMC15_000382 [Xylographa vitiligo]|nr:hypothetical protein [Xylographa vitiligo]